MCSSVSLPVAPLAGIIHAAGYHCLPRRACPNLGVSNRGTVTMGGGQECSVTAQNERLTLLMIRKAAFPRGPAFYLRPVRKPERQSLHEAVMRNALKQDPRPLRGDTSGRVLNATLRKQRSLLDDRDGRLGDLVERSNRLGVCRVRLLGDDQLGKLSRDVYVRLLHRPADYGAPSPCSSNANYGRP